MSVNQYKRRPTVSSEVALETSALGTALQAWDSDKDLGKALVMGTADNYVLAVADDDIEAIVRTIEPGTVNQGFAHGSVQTKDRAFANVGAGSANLAVRDLVVADAQSALGTVNTNGYPNVKDGVPTLIAWRVVSIVSGSGAPGSVVVIERV